MNRAPFYLSTRGVFVVGFIAGTLLGAFWATVFAVALR